MRKWFVILLLLFSLPLSFSLIVKPLYYEKPYAYYKLVPEDNIEFYHCQSDCEVVDTNNVEVEERDNVLVLKKKLICAFLDCDVEIKERKELVLDGELENFTLLIRNPYNITVRKADVRLNPDVSYIEIGNEIYKVDNGIITLNFEKEPVPPNSTRTLPAKILPDNLKTKFAYYTKGYSNVLKFVFFPLLLLYQAYQITQNATTVFDYVKAVVLVLISALSIFFLYILYGFVKDILRVVGNVLSVFKFLLSIFRRK